MLVLIRGGKIGTKRHQGYMPKERPCADTARGQPSASLVTGLWRVQSCHQFDLELLVYRQTREKIRSCCASRAICGTPLCGQGDAGLGGPLPEGSFPPGESCTPKTPESCSAASLPDRLEERVLQAGLCPCTASLRLKAVDTRL